MTSTRFILQRQSHGLDRMVANDALKLLSVQRLALYEHLSHCGVERRIAGQGRAGPTSGPAIPEMLRKGLSLAWFSTSFTSETSLRHL